MEGLGATSPLLLLLRVNLLQTWRRLVAVATQSRLLGIVTLVFVAGYMLLAFGLFYQGLRFVDRFPGLDAILTERLLFLLFAFLFVLLLFSNLVISYTNFFQNRETQFLLTLPIGHATIYRWKLIESAMLASWAFVFLIAPLLAAFGMTAGVPWHFYPATAGLIGLFIILPAVFGSWGAMVLARYLDRRSFQIALVGFGLAALAGIGLYMRPEAFTDEMLETRVLNVLERMLVKTRFAQFPLLPSYWLSSSVIHYAERSFGSSLFYAGVILANSLLFGFVSVAYLGRWFHASGSAAQSRASILGHWSFIRWWQGRLQASAMAPGLLERILGAIPGLRPDVRALVMKDILVFWRDTTQWGQTLVLFGLLGAYIMNLRHFSQQLSSPFWVNLISFLNLGACSLNLATLTTRFVFPQFSLEGKRVWIVGMAPLGIRRVVAVKFQLSVACSLALTLGLITLSCHMLRLPPERTLFFAIAITVMTLSLNGLAVGLGVLYPNFKEDNPGKIVSGFGGTFCLVLSFLYIVASIALLAVGSPWARFGTQPLQIVLACWAGFLLLSFVLGWMPLRLALRRVGSLEL